MLQGYLRPRSIEEAIDILDQYEGKARVIAGGTDLALQLKSKEMHLAALLDLSVIDELRYIVEEGGKIKIGALTTHTDLAESSILHTEAPMLSRAASSVGSLQIRNVGTVGGNIVNAQPAADTAVALLALGARATIVSGTGKREVPLEQLYLAGGGTALDPTREILREISFDSPGYRRGGGAFGRFSKRKAMVLPVFNVAAVLWMKSDGLAFKDVRIVMAPVALVPFRARAAECYLIGKSPDEANFKQASFLAAEEAKPRDSYFRGSAGYRKHIAAVMVMRTLDEAWKTLLNRGWRE